MKTQITAPTRAALYARKSTVDPRTREGEASRSVEHQLEEARQRCARESWTIVGEFTDDGISGGRVDRKDWQRLRARVRRGEIDVVVIASTSRANREASEMMSFVKDCSDLGVLLAIGHSEMKNPKSRGDRLGLGVTALVDEDYRLQLSETIKGYMAANANKGRPTGRRLYGYVRRYDENTGVLLGQEPHPDEAPFVREAVERVLAGDSLYAVAEDFQVRGVPKTTGKPTWTPTAIRRMVVNPAYAGRRIHQGKDIGEANWEPIIDLDTHQSVVALVTDEARASNRNRRDVAYLLTGIARCGVCGAKLFRGHDRKRRNVYQCRNKDPQRGLGVGHLVRDMRQLDSYIVKVLVEWLAQPDLLRRLDAALAISDTAAAGTFAEAEELQALLDEATRQALHPGPGEPRLSMLRLAAIEADLLPRIERARRAVRRLHVPKAVLDLIGPDAAARWNGLTDIDLKRSVVRSVMAITVLPGRRGSRTFDPEAIGKEWLLG